MTNLLGKTAIITGASRGIGAETARAFAFAGANVVLLARGVDEINALASEIGANALALKCDVSSYAQVEAAVAATVARFKTVDILINNAGAIEPISHLAASDPDKWGQVIDINLKGVYYGMRAVAPIMIAAGGGSIFTISSGAAYSPVEAWSHYCASKAGVVMLMQSLDHEERAKGIRVIGMSPGTVATQMQKEIKASNINPISKLEWSDHIPPEWPAKALLWMCGHEADDYLGRDISLRDPEILRRVGLSR